MERNDWRMKEEEEMIGEETREEDWVEKCGGKWVAEKDA